MDSSLFTEISIIISIAAGVAFVMHLLKQPLIIGHIITGILVGPSLLNLVSSEDTVDVFANIGIALLLFIIGLGLNPKVIKEVGKVAFLTGLGQIIFTVLIGFGILKAMDYDTTAAIIMATALAFSSTIIILKLLSDKKEQTRLYGKISIGFLLVQDIVATFALLITSAAAEGSGISTDELLKLLFNGTWIIASIVIISMFVLPRLNKVIANSQEFLFLFAVGWGFGIAALFARVGFSLEIGALIAGVGLASLPYAQEIGARLRPLRDFFVVLFFIALGAQLEIANFSAVAIQAVLLSLFVLIGNPIIVMIIMGILGYTKKTSFKAGLAVAQISEFSLVLVLLARRGHLIPDSSVALITMVALITIAVSSYMIIYADSIYNYIQNYLRLFERRKPKGEFERSNNFDMVLLGYKKGGHEFYKAFEQMHHRFVVVDYDPDVIDQLEKNHRGHYVYGDATDIELLEEISIDRAKLVVATITDFNTNMFLINHLKEINPHVIFVCHADKPEEATELYDAGATYVMMPHHIGSEKMGSFLKKNGLKKSEFKKVREKDLQYLQTHIET